MVLLFFSNQKFFKPFQKFLQYHYIALRDKVKIPNFLAKNLCEKFNR